MAFKCYLKYKEALKMTESNNPSAIRSKKEITDALFALMQKHPYNEITVKQIILEARLAKKTFYRNFTSKEDVLRSLIKRRLGEYFDVVNFARILKVPTFMSWGYNDDTCSPTSVWAAWNEILAPKEKDITPSSGHWRFPSSWDKCWKWMKALQ